MALPEEPVPSRRSARRIVSRAARNECDGACQPPECAADADRTAGKGRDGGECRYRNAAVEVLRHDRRVLDQPAAGPRSRPGPGRPWTFPISRLWQPPDFATAPSASVRKGILLPMSSGGYRRFRRYAPRMLRALEIEAAPVAAPLMSSAGLIRDDRDVRNRSIGFRASEIEVAQASHRPTRRRAPVAGRRAVPPEGRLSLRETSGLRHSRRYADLKRALVPAETIAATAAAGRSS